MELDQILYGLKKNDRWCQRALFFRYAKYLAAVCRRYYAGSSDDLEDLLQEVFMQIYKSIPLYDPQKGNFESWIKTIAIRATLRTYRKKVIKYEALDNCQQPAFDLTGYDHLLEMDVHKIIDKLPEHYRQIFLMYVVDGLSHEEISQTLSININTSRSQLMRARNLLKQYLEIQEKVPDYENR